MGSHVICFLGIHNENCGLIQRVGKVVSILNTDEVVVDGVYISELGVTSLLRQSLPCINFCVDENTFEYSSSRVNVNC